MYIGIVRCTTIIEHASSLVRPAPLLLQEFPLWHASCFMFVDVVTGVKRSIFDQGVPRCGC
ncbi:hypothetical protein NXT3_PB00102 (plasmid) [Sinorhizobium fredii]|uniref:Uncharacterized protein n=1 Tax=Rhizobium fredii TaxID=380 RepID=A0A2L0HBF4_RHIFR|nr:hypothetical protein NXT3_PB00102 [Sinorhizobium fredii]